VQSSSDGSLFRGEKKRSRNLCPTIPRFLIIGSSLDFLIVDCWTMHSAPKPTGYCLWLEEEEERTRSRLRCLKAD
jgi:hypothetical protein